MKTSYRQHYIYKTTNNINGKIYIGQRSCKGDITKDKYLGSGTIFKQALKKYGKENFTKEILEVCHDENIDLKEFYWIEEYQSTNKDIGYNILEGGGGQDKIGKLNPMYGKASPRAKPVEQLDVANNFIRAFNNAYEAAEYIVGNHSHISSCCRKQRKTHMGFKWRYAIIENTK